MLKHLLAESWCNGESVLFGCQSVDMLWHTWTEFWFEMLWFSARINAWSVLRTALRVVRMVFLIRKLHKRKTVNFSFFCTKVLKLVYCFDFPFSRHCSELTALCGQRRLHGSVKLPSSLWLIRNTEIWIPLVWRAGHHAKGQPKSHFMLVW